MFKTIQITGILFCLAVAAAKEAAGQVVPQILPIPVPAPTTPVGPALPPTPPAGCPAAPNAINFVAAATTTFDANSGIWTYRYTVNNLTSSRDAVADFAIDFAPPITNVTNPNGWVNTTFDGRNTIYWSSVAGGSFPPGTSDTGGIPPSSSDIQPGSSLSGFSFRSPNAPDAVPTYVLGYGQLPATQTEEDAEILATQCRQTSGNFFDVAVRGTAPGPAAPYVPIEITLLPYQTGNVIDLGLPGSITVGIISNAVHSALTVDPLSATFGPAGAGPQIPLLTLTQDVNGDGLLDLVLMFDKAASGITCGSTAATLNANLKPTGRVQGTTWITTANCTP